MKKKIIITQCRECPFFHRRFIYESKLPLLCIDLNEIVADESEILENCQLDDEDD